MVVKSQVCMSLAPWIQFLALNHHLDLSSTPTRGC